MLSDTEEPWGPADWPDGLRAGGSSLEPTSLRC
jgi:hypothetical protein